MKRLLFETIFLLMISGFPVVTMAGLDTTADSLPARIVFEATPEFKVRPDSRVAYIVAQADADTPQDDLAGRDEKPRDESIEKKKTTESEGKSDWKINVWPVQPPDNMKSLPERKEEDKQHYPPDRF